LKRLNRLIASQRFAVEEPYGAECRQLSRLATATIQILVAVMAFNMRCW
jgi:hypothetical protein